MPISSVSLSASMMARRFPRAKSSWSLARHVQVRMLPSPTSQPSSRIWQTSFDTGEVESFMKLKALLGIAILVGGAYIAWMMLPPYFANYQFQDDLTTIARFDS